eukprot:gb/GEZN01015743.1/.p1 GENE.gb/GEZN01015743.1/~~gb/GEZN01015743.1/.p1  ORF type:complete len:143 (+),score=39.73 gb/GEZN01015743.1/:53-481(+)
MSEAKGITLRTRRFMKNTLLNRRQMVLDVLHPNSGPPKLSDVGARLAAQYKVQDVKQVVIFGLKTDFGGGKSTGFGLIYDSLQDVLDTEPKYRLLRQGLMEKKDRHGAKLRKEIKNKKKKYFGKIKGMVGTGKMPPKKKKKE